MINIKTDIKIGRDNTAYVTSKIRGMSNDQMRGFAHDIVVQARENASAIPFKESTGNLAGNIESSQIGVAHYRIETRSGHASWIEFGTQFIKGKMPFLWPAYRLMKKRFFRSGKWV